MCNCKFRKLSIYLQIINYNYIFQRLNISDQIFQKYNCTYTYKNVFINTYIR